MKYLATLDIEIKFAFYICVSKYFTRVAYFIAKLFHSPKGEFH